MSKLEMSSFLGLKEYNALNTDSIIGGNSSAVKKKCKCKCKCDDPNDKGKIKNVLID